MTWRTTALMAAGWASLAIAPGRADAQAADSPAAAGVPEPADPVDSAAAAAAIGGSPRGAARLQLGAFVGGAYLSGQSELGNAFFADQVPRSSALLGVRAAYTVLPALWPDGAVPARAAVELEARGTLSRTGRDTRAGRDRYFAPVLGWRMHGRLDLWPERRLRPHLLVGVGGETVLSQSPFMASGDTDAAFHYGAGASWSLGDSRGLRVDIRHVVAPGRQQRTAATVEFQLGFYFALGDRGRRRSTPTAPTSPTALDGAGALGSDDRPAPDRDGDGVPDAADLCPDEAEGQNGIDDDDGCPELDPDVDGLVGDADRCPAEPEDVDGFEDDDGCPDADNDADGRPDSIDACPIEPETRNGFEDDDGCPDAVPAALAAVAGVVRGVAFAPGSDRLGPGARAPLARVVRALTEHPDVRVRVLGFTDDSGDAADNTALSARRAEAVKRSLIDAGIAADRVEAVGRGPEAPIASNATAAGRARNRRIEIALIPGLESIPDPLAP